MKCAYYGCLLVGQLICCTLQCQYYFAANNRPEPDLMWEAGIAAGAVNCLTDIGGNSGNGKKFIKDINLNQTQLCGSLFVSATWQSRFAIRLAANVGRVTGNDAVLKNSTGAARNRYLRNLQFRTSLFELAVTTELHLLPILFRSRNLPVLSPYLLGGIGFFHYNPQAMLNSRWIDLRPLHTEGQSFKEYPQRNAYSTISWCIPAGAGVKYDVSRLVNCRMELVYRFTGTDYLDDVSQNYIDPALYGKYLSPSATVMAMALADRSAELAGGVKNNFDAIRGNPTNKDAWFSFMFAVSIALGRLQSK